MQIEEEENFYEDIDRVRLAELLGLPLRIYGTLTYAGMSGDGELVLYIKKSNQYKLVEFLRKLRVMKGRELYMYIDEGDWTPDAHS